MRSIINIVKKIEQECRKIGFDQASNQEVGKLLACLCAGKPHGTFLELGTGCGLSTVWMADGMDAQSRLITVDNDENVISVAKKYLAKDKRITFLCENGESVIDQIPPGTVDVIFADTWPGKYHYLDEALALLKVGGIYVIDDMLPQKNWPEGHNKKAKALAAYLHHKENLKVVSLHWATGVMIATKTA